MTNPSRDGFWSHHSGSAAHKRQVRSNRGPLGAVKIAGSREKGLLPSIPAIMAWYADWEARKEALLKVGLPVLVRGVELRNGFLSITLDADEACLLRTHAARGFDLHVSLGYIQEYDSPIDALEASMRLHNRWAGQLVLLNIAWVGSGGAAFLHEYDLINEDPDFQYLYIRGRYWKRGAHVSL